MRLWKEDTFLLKMLKEVDVAKKERENSRKKGKLAKPDPRMKKITSFFITVQPSMTILLEQQHEEMEWEEQESVMSDVEADPHDWLKMEKSRDRAIRLRRAYCQRKTWRKLQKKK